MEDGRNKGEGRKIERKRIRGKLLEKEEDKRDAANKRKKERKKQSKIALRG